MDAAKQNQYNKYPHATASAFGYAGLFLILGILLPFVGPLVDYLLTPSELKNATPYRYYYTGAVIGTTLITLGAVYDSAWLILIGAVAISVFSIIMAVKSKYDTISDGINKIDRAELDKSKVPQINKTPEEINQKSKEQSINFSNTQSLSNNRISNTKIPTSNLTNFIREINRSSRGF